MKFFLSHTANFDVACKGHLSIIPLLTFMVEYKDEMTMIPKNSSVVVRRIPVGTKSKAQLAA